MGRERRPALVVSALVVAILTIAAFEGVGPFAPGSGFLQAIHLAPRPGSTGPSRPGVASASGPGPSTTTSTLTLASRTYRPGECVTWDEQASGSSVLTPSVACADPHLIEMTARRSLTTSSAGAAFPDGAAWQQIDATVCGPAAERFLGYPLDPTGRFFATSLRPTPLSWKGGDRTIWCGIAARAASGPPPSDLLAPFTGAVQGQPQTLLYATGTCLAPGAPGSLGAPVPCDGVHALEVVGSVSLAGLTALPQSEAQWSAAVAATCSREAAQYVGGALPPGVGAGWLTYPSASWDAGRRVTQCTVGWYDAGGSLTTGSTPLRSGAT